MSRIEEAILKLKAKAQADAQAQPQPGRPGSASRPLEGVAQVTQVPLRPAAPGPAAPADAAAAPPPRAPSRTIQIDLGDLTREGLIAPSADARRIANEFRAIKRALIANVTGRAGTRIEGGSVMMVASALPHEGKTFCAFNLALTLSLEKDYSVVLIDGDVVKPHITTVLGLSGAPGLLDVLKSGADLADVEIGTNIPGLTVVPAGKRDDDAAELLSSNRMLRMVEQMRATPGRLYVFDSTPLLLTNEARVLSEVAGQIMLVVRAASTPRSAVQSAISQLPEDVYIGVVLNQKAAASGQDYYSYGEYGRYGQGQGQE